jgi:hypothetical protein
MTYIQKNSPLKQLDDNAQKRAMKKEDRAARKQMRQGEKEANPKNQKKKAIEDIRTNYKIQKLQGKLNN